MHREHFLLSRDESSWFTSLDNVDIQLFHHFKVEGKQIHFQFYLPKWKMAQQILETTDSHQFTSIDTPDVSGVTLCMAL